MTKGLKIVAINGSPNRRGGNTGRLIQMILKPLKEDGFEVEHICLAEKLVWYCAGCGICLENEAGKCWIDDDHAGIVKKLLDADGIILASPVYILGVTAQMKAFLDRSLGVGHKLRTSWKPGISISVSAGMGETEVVNYLSHPGLKIFGAFPVSHLTAISVRPGEFLGLDAIKARAFSLAGDFARAIKEKQQYVPTDKDLLIYQFFCGLIKRNVEVMEGDYKYWEKSGLFNGFEAFVKQSYSEPPQIDKELVKERRKRIFVKHNEQYKKIKG